jgi:mRNA-degrading endonuclease toxin of MazEF toxin-antitoxin module
MNRGDVILVRFPHPTGLRGKKRPAVVVQSDGYTNSLGTVVVAQVTKNLSMAEDPACLFVDTSTPEGKATGLVRDSVVSCLLLATVDASTVAQVLGTLSPSMARRLDDCLRASLGIP